MKEIWKSITGYEDSYEVSNMGRVRTKPRKRRCGIGGSGDFFLKSKLLRLVTHSRGYLQIGLRKPGSDSKTRLVHQIVLEEFIGKRPSGFHGCHNNGKKTDNRLVNLRWDSPIGNALDNLMHGTDGAGERNSMCKLTDYQVVEIRDKYVRRGKISQRILAALYGVSQSQISNIILSKRRRVVFVKVEPHAEIVRTAVQSRSE